jgi:hypothetical protein
MIKKGKEVSQNKHGAARKERIYRCYSFTTSALDGGEWSKSLPRSTRYSYFLLKTNKLEKVSTKFAFLVILYYMEPQFKSGIGLLFRVFLILF